MRTLAGTGTLVRLILRRDRIRLPVWIGAILALVYLSAQAVQGLYSSPAELAAYDSTVGQSPASIAMSGPPTALRTIGGVTVFEVNTSAIIAVALMAVFLVVRHTRGEEELGRTELLRAGQLGRHAQLAAAMLVVGAASIVVGAGICAAFASQGLPLSGSLLYGASIAALGIVFTGIAAVAAQLTEHARGALGIGGAVLAAAFLLRAVGDLGDQTVSLLSPIGWSQAVRPFGDERAWPLALSGVALVVLLVAALALDGRRDLGAGLAPPRPGPATASRLLSSPLGLSIRQQRASIAWWAFGLFVGGVSFGSLGREVTDLVRSNPQLREVLGGSGVDLVDTFFATAMLILALTAGAFTVASVLRLRAEEAAGRAEPLLASAVPRTRWAAHGLVVPLGGSVLVLGAAGFGTGLAHSLATGDWSQLPRLVGAALAYLPAIMALGGLAVLVFGWAPRATVAVWGFFAGCFVVGWLGNVLDIPAWLADLSPFTHIAQVPAEPLAWAPLAWLALISVGCVTVGVANLSKRDIA